MESSEIQESKILDGLKRNVKQANNILSKFDVKAGHVRKWSSSLRVQICKIFGSDHEISKSLLPKYVPENIDYFAELEKRKYLLENFIDSIERLGANIFLDKNEGSKIFIGHGRSPIWRELKDFLSDRLLLAWEEFNREAVAGFTTFERISNMLDSAIFAFLIMTAEDQHADDTTHARQNVVHEVGLFQGRLGPKKAIILLEEGCSEFSNIIGLSQIRFPRNNISAVFEDIRRVLEREKIINS